MKIGPGQLIIKPVSAQISHNTEWFGKMDPYLEFEFEGQVRKTEVCYKGGTTPTWGDTFSFNRTNGHLLNITLWDHQRFKQHDLIANNEVNLLDIFQKGRVDKDFELLYDGSPGATVRMSVEFKPTSSQKQQGGQLSSLMDSRRNSGARPIYQQPIQANGPYGAQNSYPVVGNVRAPTMQSVQSNNPWIEQQHHLLQPTMAEQFKAPQSRPSQNLKKFTAEQMDNLLS